ncbi:unnamed protein product [Peniophora sp. CBMAI 1063]|nr:unnamed protein product [Peniophora sp. CBMAI 1063]
MASGIPHSVSSTTSIMDMDQFARKACGPGDMHDLVTPPLLQTELEGFYQGDPQSSAAASLLRFLSALDTLLALPVESLGVSTSQIRILWKLFFVEQALFIAQTPSPDVDLIQKFTPDKHPSEMLDDASMLRVATGQSKLGPLAALEHRKLGPLQWWLAAGIITNGRAMQRQDIYNSVLQLFAEQQDRTLLPSSQTEPTQAAGQHTSNFDFFADSPTPTGTEANTFGAGSVGQNSAPATPPMVGNAAVTAHRGIASPWLAPREFRGEISWRIGDMNQLVDDLLHWPSGQSVPDALIWEHPAMHGCLVDVNGRAPQFQAGYVHF